MIICHILATGNRAGTVCNLRNFDVNFSSHEINLNVVKNRKAYIIPISTKYEKILKEYMSHRGGKPEDYLFCNAYQDPLSGVALQNTIREYNRKRGVSRTSIHAFRHTFAKKWVLNGGDIFRLQQMLGHSSLEMVTRSPGAPNASAASAPTSKLPEITPALVFIVCCARANTNITMSKV